TVCHLRPSGKQGLIPGTMADNQCHTPKRSRTAPCAWNYRNKAQQQQGKILNSTFQFGRPTGLKNDWPLASGLVSPERLAEIGSGIRVTVSFSKQACSWTSGSHPTGSSSSIASSSSKNQPAR